MVEYAALLAQTGMLSLTSLGHTAEVWLSNLNWDVVKFGILGLLVLRIATWAFRTR